MPKPIQYTDVDIMVDDETLARLNQLAKQANTTPSVVAALMLALFVEQHGAPKKKKSKKTK